MTPTDIEAGWMTGPIADKAEILAVLKAKWGSHRLVAGLQLLDSAQGEMHGLWSRDGELLAFVSWVMKGQSLYVCALHSLDPGQGHARLMLDHIIAHARRLKVRTVRAMLTNDNIPGLLLYQKRGFRYSNLFVGAVDAMRPLEPNLIRIGHEGIEVHDAIEMELAL